MIQTTSVKWLACLIASAFNPLY